MGRKFLIIDDSALMRRVISDIIKLNSEYEVLDTAVDGVDGLDKLVAHPGYYDLVILDINMPKMNGLEMLERKTARAGHFGRGDDESDDERGQAPHRRGARVRREA